MRPSGGRNWDIPIRLSWAHRLGQIRQRGKRREIWAAGYTPQRVTVIWLGLPRRREAIFTLPWELKSAGGVWNAVMRQSLTDQPASDWTIPGWLSYWKYVIPSGLLPTRTCPSHVTEVFLQGSEPNSIDDLYRAVQINRETGRIATVFTPPGLLEEGVFLAVPDFAREWAHAVGKNYAAHGLRHHSGRGSVSFGKN